MKSVFYFSLRGTVAAALLALVVSCSSNVADRLKEADAAFERGEYETALQIYRELAEQDLAVAQFNIGYLYHHGKGRRAA